SSVGATPATLKGGGGTDYLYGGPGNDTLIGGAGNDFETGGGGNDSYSEDSQSNGAESIGTTNLHGSDAAVPTDPGTDTVDYSARSFGVTVTTGDAMANDGQTLPPETDNVDSSIENVKGGSGGDTISGADAVANTLNGGGGDDTLNGLGGNDLLIGGAGTDTENGGSEDDTFDEGSAANGGDTLNGGAGNDTADYSKRTNRVVVNLTTGNDGSATDGEQAVVNPPTPAEGDKVQSDVENAVGGK